MVFVKVSAEEVDVLGSIKRVMSPDCGGISVFVGTVRDNYDSRPVRGVSIEAYDTMAIEDLERIAKEIKNEFRIREISIQHRTGELDVGDVMVVIAVSAPHRKEAFAACREVLERLKKTTPIWKQEFFDGGQRWAEDEKYGSNG